MSSSQTMTAPAVGHRPPDAGPSMSSVYDYGPSQHPDHPPPSPPSDSAIRALHDSASPANVHGASFSSPLPATMPVKSEPEDSNLSASDALPDANPNVRRQSAASALLAQLLGNQSSAPSDAGGPDQPVPPPADPETAYHHSPPHHLPDLPQPQHHPPPPPPPPGPDDGMNGHDWSADPPAESLAAVDSSEAQDQNPVSLGGLLPPFQPEEKISDEASAMAFSNPDLDDALPAKSADPIEGLTDPLLLSKSGLDHPDLFTPFDITGAPKTPYEALHQNEMLTAAYLSQSADLSALGYSGATLHQDGAGSMSGSEPRIQAFAKLEFDDGHFYCNTYSFILGRDVRAARAAHERELQARQAVRTSRAKSSSGGNTSHTPVRVKHEGSGILGSVVSDRGGILGFDPDVPPHLPRVSRRSSNSSHAESGAPLHATPAQLQSTTDYNALAMQSLNDGNGDAKPVDTLALLPSPDACPTIPIHPPATVDGTAAGHRGISRKHVKIAYNFEGNFFEMEVMGRNGAFIGADWLSPGQLRPLHSGDYIQIGGVRIRFLLPDVPIGETGAEVAEEPFADDENAQMSVVAGENDFVDDKPGLEGSENKDGTRPTKLVLKTKDSDSTRPVPSIEGSGDGQQPIRRRGPGRPPKDGIMSKRERAELAREQKMAAKREANGGVTPPPNRPKAGKAPVMGAPSTTPKESVGAESPGSKPEKRKYTKRKKPDGTSMDFPLPSTEGGQFPMEQRPEDFIKAPPVKKRKPSRSPSPNYPPESAYTPEDLAKPPYNYAVLIFDALTEAGTPMTLKQIYRALKLKYPYFRFKCETEGWTSSVRHNLNGNSHLFMHAERDGKGWSWQLRPGASVEKEKKRRPSPPPVSQPPSMPATTPQYMPPMTSPYASQPNGQTGMASAHFQFPTMPPSNPYTAPSPAPPPAPAAAPPPPPPPPAPVSAPAPAPPSQQPSPFPLPPQASASTPFPIPTPLRNNLPPAFAQTTPSTYTSPYASDPPPQLVQFQQSQQTQPPSQSQAIPPQPQSQPQPQQHQPSPYPPQHPPPMSSFPPQPQQNLAPASGPPPQHPPNPNVAPSDAGPGGPMDHSEALSFNERANKAIDDFEAVLMEDYEDKNYIREVLKSSRARVLGEATESSFPGGEPKDEAVILDALRNLIGSLKDQ
ncbi:hypothetical protein P170DRAFT_350204 [Aspergillus steynii IBT 23096]|uniref:Forkhead domain protein n=1 Tax=Aspergillus steynii IBT 23096 TaxID=1392250 RepID=A0A2I2GJG9_9EURO|nr:uncharacterized protein P170DRAFT_350204 [Aspergillus steynii IBT 23096]PLB53026.1 hypothetical protein P170DRAFT_350204 [Aspergillus steynii IBT 23096]